MVGGPILFAMPKAAPAFFRRHCWQRRGMRRLLPRFGSCGSHIDIAPQIESVAGSSFTPHSRLCGTEARWRPPSWTHTPPSDQRLLGRPLTRLAAGTVCGFPCLRVRDVLSTGILPRWISSSIRGHCGQFRSRLPFFSLSRSKFAGCAEEVLANSARYRMNFAFQLLNVVFDHSR
jgi:hypothetical protein